MLSHSGAESIHSAHYDDDVATEEADQEDPEQEEDLEQQDDSLPSLRQHVHVVPHSEWQSDKTGKYIIKVSGKRYVIQTLTFICNC